MTDEKSAFVCAHDAYLKLYQLSDPQLDYDCILLDEAQDTNPVLGAIVAGQRGQKIFVGINGSRSTGGAARKRPG